MKPFKLYLERYLIPQPHCSHDDVLEFQFRLNKLRWLLHFAERQYPYEHSYQRTINLFRDSVLPDLISDLSKTFAAIQLVEKYCFAFYNKASQRIEIDEHDIIFWQTLAANNLSNVFDPALDRLMYLEHARIGSILKQFRYQYIDDETE